MSQLIYRCPECGNPLCVDDDSDEYRVACPSCKNPCDLTELEPEMSESDGFTIRETEKIVLPGAKPDPLSNAVQKAVLSASVAASNVAAAGVRTFRTLQGKFSGAHNRNRIPETSAPAKSPTGPAFAPAQVDPVEAGIAQTVSCRTRVPKDAGYEEGRRAFAEGRFAEAVAIFRQAAAKGDRASMLALSGCLLKGVASKPDFLSSRLWQNRAKASAAEIEAALLALGTIE